ncbi:phasin [Asticcacaulis sp. EMRT-3]|uniref:phasin n=1 Tax=Asticcacaulis sp. EMRT-3 TaxID=3040349 RepID=UPI0024AF0ED3|nr:phasin [Asticcacaulis sp. EMRT-3]MDI7776114.1 phasin [Asticcacaulis sp. EMRT-3]
MTTRFSPFTQSSFEAGLKLMEAQSQLAARSLINLIEMISTSTHRYSEDTDHFTQEAMRLMNAAASAPDAAALAEVQKRWAETCLTYGKDRTQATLNFVEQCGQQALNIAARHGQGGADQNSSEAPKT